MYIEKYGSGDRVFFGLHGWGGDHTTFMPFVRQLPENVTFYSADLPGYGKTPAPREWMLSALSEEIVTAIDTIKAMRIVLLGSCSGAILGLLAAQALRNRVARIVLIDPFAYMPFYFKLFVATDFGKIAYYTTFANPVGRWLTNMSLKNR